MSSVLLRADDGSVECSDGWAVRVVGPELMEYRCGKATCLVNVGYSAHHRTREIFATESNSDLFPNLRENLQSAASMLQGHYIVV
jgi:hypothetical protein